MALWTYTGFPSIINVKSLVSWRKKRERWKDKGIVWQRSSTFWIPNFYHLSTTISNYGTPNKDCGFSPSQESFGGSGVKSCFSGGEKPRLKNRLRFHQIHRSQKIKISPQDSTIGFSNTYPLSKKQSGRTVRAGPSSNPLPRLQNSQLVHLLPGGILQPRYVPFKSFVSLSQKSPMRWEGNVNYSPDISTG